MSTTPTPEQAARNFLDAMKACEIPPRQTAALFAAASAWAKAAELRKEREIRGRAYAGN